MPEAVMAGIFAGLSDLMIPMVMVFIISYGWMHRRKVYEDFIIGAKDGLETVVQIMPTLVGLMVAVGVLRASGFLDMIGNTIGAVTAGFGFPAELVPVALIRMFSSSAATGLVLDLFKTYGPDSEIGLMTSIMMSCTETVFYTMSVYFMAAGVSRTRYTLSGALLSTIVGIAASILLAGMMK